MDFFSLEFLAFLFVTVIACYKLPQALRPYILLVASFVFYYVGAAEFLPLMLCICLVTWLFGFLINKFRKPWVYAGGIVCIISALLYFKYAAFFAGIAERLFRFELDGTVLDLKEVIVPLGISFMTFQAISYLGDIYNGKIVPEKNPVLVALQVSFFPNVTAGPIQKARTFIPQIKAPAIFEYDQVRHGLLLFAFGGLQKYYISDKLAVMIDSMQNALLTEPGHKGFHILFFAFVYAIYIYSNFNSYSDMAIGIAKMLGIRFEENFRRPYLSKSIKEFWQRWHISLNSWFVEYVYIPLGGSRKGRIRYYCNILIIFFLSGLWHGASIHFIAWGLLNGLYQIIGNLTAGLRGKIYRALKIDQESKFAVAWKRLCTFYLIAVSWILFAIPGTSTGIKMIPSMIFPPILSLFDGWILGQFSTLFSAISLLCTILVFFRIQIKRENGSVSECLCKQPAIVRYAVYIGIVVLLLFGYVSAFNGLGDGGFIYGDF